MIEGVVNEDRIQYVFLKLLTFYLINNSVKNKPISLIFRVTENYHFGYMQQLPRQISNTTMTTVYR